MMFGPEVVDHRRRLGMTQDDLAVATGLSVRSIRDVENGRVSRPRTTTVRLLAEAFGLVAGQHAEFVRLAAGLPRGSAPTPLVTPAELPSPSGNFTGRERDTTRLSDVVHAARDAGSMPFVAVVGPAGVGKTTFVVHWAHRMRSEFPDGQIFTDLRGFSTEPHTPPATALRRLLWSLGVPADRIPHDPDEAAALYRSLLSDKRMLIVLDNAISARQVRPLLPGGPGNAVVVTSRNQLPELTAQHGSRQLVLDALTGDEAHQLIRRVIGGKRLAVEPDAARNLASRCGHLPLALCIAAAHLAGNPNQTITAYLTGQHTGSWLNTLSSPGDPEQTVKAAFDLSLRTLTERQQKLLDLLGLIPGPTFTVATAAALTGDGPAAAEQDLVRLANAHLIQHVSPDRFAFHDLIREYATNRADAQPTELTTESTLRLYHFYRDVTDSADRIRQPGALRLPTATDAIPPAPDLDEQSARAWFTDETANLVAACLQAGSSSRTEVRTVATRLADALSGHLWTRRDLATWTAVANCAADAARTDDDLTAQASAEIALAKIANCRCAYPTAMTHLGKALHLSRRAGWQAAEAETLGSMAALHDELGDAPTALRCWQAALTISRQTGARLQQGRTLLQIGIHHHEQGQLTKAQDTLETALKLVDAENSRIGRAIILNNLADVYLLRQDFDQAAAHADEVLRICDDLGHISGTVFAQLVQSAANRGRRLVSEALHDSLSALAIATTLDDAHTLSNAHHEVAESYDAIGDQARGIEHHRAAHRLTILIQSRFLDLRHSIALTIAAHRLSQTGLAAHHRLIPPNLPDLTAALRQAHDSGYRSLEGAALAAIAEISRDTGDHANARRYARRSLALQSEAGWRTDRALLTAIVHTASTSAQSNVPKLHE
jgi:tetratricopeptide (TPR) repeat protein/transcriptional regulator with XRE-family HTH domain